MIEQVVRKRGVRDIASTSGSQLGMRPNKIAETLSEYLAECSHAARGAAAVAEIIGVSAIRVWAMAGAARVALASSGRSCVGAGGDLGLAIGLMGADRGAATRVRQQRGNRSKSVSQSQEVDQKFSLVACQHCPAAGRPARVAMIRPKGTWASGKSVRDDLRTEH